ncbi:helix-turn-helix domain-containing protein [Candidatus Poribacteria bacterium]|nr:helix-turn-helix domain-containing protein [Candidatus Poribacteria bacterium]
MTKTLTITEATQVLGCSDKTIRRWIESGKLTAEKVGRKWYVQVNVDVDQDINQEPDLDSDSVNVQHLQAQLERADSEIQHLREQIDHLTQVVAMSQKNIGALTEQLDDSRQMIEDMRQRRTVWQRLKGVFVAESV